MLLQKSITQSWSIGLDNEQVRFIKDTLGEEHELIMLSCEALSRISLEDKPAPFVIWMSSRACSDLQNLPEHMVKYLDTVPKVLMLAKGYTIEDFETACDYGFSEIVRPPFSRERIAEIMRRSIEAYTLHHDIECMAREISLERELFERKNEILNFLVNFLSTSTESLDIAPSLQTAFQGLGTFLPVTAMNVALWEENETGTHDVSLYISAAPNTPDFQAWHKELLDQTTQYIPPDFTVTDIQELHVEKEQGRHLKTAPENGAQLTLPLICGTERMGVIILSTSMDRHLGRDQAMALDSAMRHFSLTIKNARRFRQMQIFADYDALTKVHSRRHFGNRLTEEMERLNRYGQPLSLIMLDIDHFKQVNDTRGHHVGDIVLSEVGGVIASCIRTTDYCARYGGEEFSVILPHTDSKKAFALAERIRKTIGNHVFLVEGGGPLTVTVSLGVSSLLPGETRGQQALICEADEALYAAKQGGRNRSVLSSHSSNQKQQRNIG